MFERGGLDQPPNSVEEIEEMIIWQNQQRDELRKLVNENKL